MVFLGSGWFRDNGIAAVVERFAATAEPPFDGLVTITDSVDAAVAAIAKPTRPVD